MSCCSAVARPLRRSVPTSCRFSRGATWFACRWPRSTGSTRRAITCASTRAGATHVLRGTMKELESFLDSQAFPARPPLDHRQPAAREGAARAHERRVFPGARKRAGAQAVAQLSRQGGALPQGRRMIARRVAASGASSRSCTLASCGSMPSLLQRAGRSGLHGSRPSTARTVLGERSCRSPHRRWLSPVRWANLRSARRCARAMARRASCSPSLFSVRRRDLDVAPPGRRAHHPNRCGPRCECDRALRRRLAATHLAWTAPARPIHLPGVRLSAWARAIPSTYVARPSESQMCRSPTSGSARCVISWTRIQSSRNSASLASRRDDDTNACRRDCRMPSRS